ncbi:hypothetical protein BBK82_19885 [Lentzea guizhouensis]|uniref:Uncharacterized protein n=1 Tax=Lentzea guizhouensis TaxID=1586287 RepID=A0A1B2HYV3_9PSEU|nr:hypothetical protein BBK82_19885 [Lentzea guizhouensis]
MGLVLDAEDTAVTDVTAKALLRRGDATGLAVVCAATAGAEGEQHDHLYAALWDVLGVFERDRDAALATCRALADDPAQDDRVRSGAAAVGADLAAFQPVLRAGLPKVTAE